ncbi:MAG TPA: J domain-containing protein [Kofleriaceae bacterium]|nr:J domain-containing protein [Kofleriaceae bacterium]
MAGIDELSARAALTAMQDRLARDPAAALGLSANATFDDVRTAFLQLTKQFHPVRFGRMAVDIQKLSNEVFLALRAAHDALTRGLKRPTGPIPTPGARPPAPSAIGSQGMTPMPGSAAAPAPPVPVHAAATPGSGRVSQPVPQKPARPSTGEPQDRPPAPRAPTPATGVKIPASRPPAAPPASRPPATPAPVRPQASPPVAPTPPASALRDEAAVLDLLQRQQWDQARSLLQQLSGRDPSSKRLRALMAYARGREAQFDRRVDDARVELQDALELDPDLAPAKTALTELFTRRK